MEGGQGKLREREGSEKRGRGDAGKDKERGSEKRDKQTYRRWQRKVSERNRERMKGQDQEIKTRKRATDGQTNRSGRVT